MTLKYRDGGLGVTDGMHGMLGSAFVVFVLLFPFEAIAQDYTAPRANAWVTDGEVYAIAPTPEAIYIGGDFSYAGPYTGGAALISAGSGELIPDFPVVNGYVVAVAPDGAGGWYIGGAFSKVGGVARNNLAQISAGGEVTAWNPGVWLDNPSYSAIVWDIVFSDGIVYAGGYFSGAGGASRRHIAAVDAVTGAATDWNPDPNCSVRGVTALEVSGGLVYASGDFSTIGGQARKGIAALDSVTGDATAWNPGADSSIYIIMDIAVSDGVVYVGGSFSKIGGVARANIAALNAVTGETEDWDPAPGGSTPLFFSIVISGDIVYVGGYFNSIGGESRANVAALDRITGLATGWNPQPSSLVSSLAVSGGKVYIAGEFTAVGGVARANIAALNADTGLLLGFSPAASAGVYALSATEDNVLAGGAFSSVGGVTRRHIAALDPVTGAATEWNPEANDTVRCLAVMGDMVYAGGDFSAIGGEERYGIAAVNRATGLTVGWEFSGCDDTVRALVISDGVGYAGGDFAAIGGAIRSRIAALDMATGQALPWNPGTNKTVHALALSQDKLYVGGSFTTIGGLGRNRIAAVNRFTGQPSSWNPNAGNTVYSLSVAGDLVYAGGQFSQIGGLARQGVAALDCVSGEATEWHPEGFYRTVSLAVSNGVVYAGNYFSSLPHYFPNWLEALDTGTGESLGFNPDLHQFHFALPSQGLMSVIPFEFPFVSALAISGGVLHVGGAFTAVGDQFRTCYAQFDIPPESGDEGEGEGLTGLACLILDEFTVFDSSGAGTITLPVLLSTLPGMLTGHFDMLDANGDAFLRVSELLEASGGAGAVHRADLDGNGAMSLSELLRMIQFYNSNGYHCADNAGASEDGYIAGIGAALSCVPHAGDYHPRDWRISLSELLRVMQFYNTGGYHFCPDDLFTEDDFCAGAAP